MTAPPVRLGGAAVLDGREVSRRLLEQCRATSAELLRRFTITPQLAVVLVGDDAASSIYVRAKERACARAGVLSRVVRLPESSTTQRVSDAVDELVRDGAVHSIIVQLPLPGGVETHTVLERIPVDKDGDGFHRYNVAGLVMGQNVFPPCTPDGVLRLLDDAGIEVAGANVVVVGASNVVGKPMALMALQRGATVTVCHAQTRDLAEHTRRADILVCAAGQPALITADMVRDGAVVVDVGINRLSDGSVTGDVCYEEVAAIASHVSPVPGGVGPMTVAVLVANTVRAAARSAGIALSELSGNALGPDREETQSSVSAAL
jgi:methylenetetrahydrofolate dehydrogenase (NADP+)/methenyltetrahydrofolate cyclohydrolase